MQLFSLEPSNRDHIMIADVLFPAYRKFYHLGPNEVAIYMRDTYHFHVDTLNASLNNRHGQQDRDGNGDSDGDGEQNQLVTNEPVHNEVV